MTSINSITPRIAVASDATVTNTHRFTQPADETANPAVENQGVSTASSAETGDKSRIQGPAGVGKGGGAGEAESSSEDSESVVIQTLKEQIEALQKQLAAQTAQLQAAQDAPTDDRTKATTVATLQAGVTSTQAALSAAMSKLAAAYQEQSGSSTGNIVHTTA